MAHLEIPNAEVFFQTFAELMAKGQEDKQIARKLSCSRGEVKRLRQTFSHLEIVVQDKFDAQKLNDWLHSQEGQRAQKQWEGQHRQNKMGGVGQNQKGGLNMPTAGKRQWNRQKV